MEGDGPVFHRIRAKWGQASTRAGLRPGMRPVPEIARNCGKQARPLCASIKRPLTARRRLCLRTVPGQVKTIRGSCGRARDWRPAACGSSRSISLIRKKGAAPRIPDPCSKRPFRRPGARPRELRTGRCSPAASRWAAGSRRKPRLETSSIRQPAGLVFFGYPLHPPGKPGAAARPAPAGDSRSDAVPARHPRSVRLAGRNAGPCRRTGDGATRAHRGRGSFAGAASSADPKGQSLDRAMDLAAEFILQGSFNTKGTKHTKETKSTKD